MTLQMEIQNEFLQKYLEYVEDTETPRIMHLWSVLAGAGACLGRRVYLPFGGVGNIFPNLYVLLVGPPGVKKSTAIKIMAKRLSESTAVRFAPDDTAGQRQGLIEAIAEDEATDPDVKKLMNGHGTFDIDDLLNVELNVSIKDRHCMFAAASEFSSVIGTNARELVKFFGKAWDGEDYKYKIKSTEKILNEPLFGFVGGTTPTQIAEDFPPGAIGQGFTSRIVFVFDNQRYKKVSNPPPFDENLERLINSLYKDLYYNREGPMRMNAEAEVFNDEIYEYVPSFQDPRFVYYADRRQTHYLKLSIILTALEGRYKIERRDIEQAHQLLQETEKRMPEALGEFGLSPTAIGTQRLLEFIEGVEGEPLPEQVLWQAASRDFSRRTDFMNALANLVASGKVQEVNTKKLGRCFVSPQKHLFKQALESVSEISPEGRAAE